MITRYRRRRRRVDQLKRFALSSPALCCCTPRPRRSLAQHRPYNIDRCRRRALRHNAPSPYYICCPGPPPMDSRASSLSPVIDPDDSRSPPGSPAPPAPMTLLQPRQTAVGLHARRNHNNNNDNDVDDDEIDDDDDDDIDDDDRRSSGATAKSPHGRAPSSPSDHHRALIAGITAAAAAAVAGMCHSTAVQFSCNKSYGVANVIAMDNIHFSMYCIVVY